MVNTNEVAVYLDAGQVSNGQLLTIGPESTHKTTTFKQRDGSERKRIQIGVREYDLPIVLNNTSLKNLKKEWGADTAKWVGKKVKVVIAAVNVAGELRDALYLQPAGK